MDSQIKLRGQRIELVEIELQLIKALPQDTYSVMPFNGNGKTDRKRLNARASEFSMQLFSKYGSMPVDHQPPTTPTEKEMQRIWSQVLKLKRSCIGINDKLFRLGGDSITAMRLVAMFRDNGFRISVDEIFKHPTICELSAVARNIAPEAAQETRLPLSLLPNHFLVDEIRREAAEECGVLLDSVENIYPCTPFQESLMTLSIKQKGAYMVQLTYRIPESVDLGQLEMAWRNLHAHHDILRTRIIQILVDSIFALIHNNANSICLVWTISHALYDGIILPLMFENLEEYYIGQVPTRTAQFQRFIKSMLDVDHERAEVYWVSQLLVASAKEFCKRPTPDYAPISHHKLKKSIIFTKENGLRVTKAIIATVPVRMKHEDHDFLIDYLGRAQQQSAQMTTYEHYGLRRIRECCGEAKTALEFQTFLIVDGKPDRRFMQSRIGLEYCPSDQIDFYSYPVNVEIFLQDSGADVEIHFDGTMIAPWQITRIVSQLEFVIQQLCRADVTSRIRDIEYVSAADFKELYKWNSEVGPAIMETLHGLVDEAAQRNPQGRL
ncbi:uncharacterized protein EAF02_001927 [Botrytis sinoallii]|uniref:uncharacterized protein n=1 Tax=Botrytis sinoallii TaxID=1463999 RepID=UPI0019025727|nr:uncharacterized protein EAF02_001927 [Botrytis sinoallii]KAF7889512.1 hypothetical protein EAF02_001927 [Botrytis sinoallii]